MPKETDYEIEPPKIVLPSVPIIQDDGKSSGFNPRVYSENDVLSQSEEESIKEEQEAQLVQTLNVGESDINIKSEVEQKK